jgi:Na+/H+-dicarboxylate symporter
MARTTVNITGDSACAVVIAASENELNRNAGISNTVSA